ncbi:MAG: hypothetical protein P1U39_02775 [Legionellaceae bacterium]|nr:hypothetical protein [Legionellaceae bacterium]
MPATTPSTPFELLIDYLQGKKDAHQLRSAFTEGRETRDAFATYQNTALTTLTTQQIEQLKTELAMPESAGFGEAENLLDLIDNLNKAGYGYGQLADFRYHIKQIKPEADWTETLYTTTLITGIVSSFFFLNGRQRDRLEAVLVRIAPAIAPMLLVGLQIYNIFKQAYTSLYEDTYHSDGHRFRRWLVGTLPALFNLAAYATIAVVGSMSPFAAILFVSASLVAIADGIHRIYDLVKVDRTAESGTASAIRQQNRIERTHQTLRVKIYAALALVATVLVSCIFPPSIFVVLAYSALFILIPWTKNSFLNKIHKESSHQLLTELHELEDSSTNSTDDVERLKNTVVELKAEVERCHAKLATREARASNTGLFKPDMASITGLEEYGESPSQRSRAATL